MPVYTNRTFYEGTPGTSSGTLATVPAGEEWLLDEVIADNTTASAATLTVNHVPAGGSVATGNQLVSAFSCAANTDTNALPNPPAGIRLAPGDTIRGLQGTAAALNVRITGRVRNYG